VRALARVSPDAATRPWRPLLAAARAGDAEAFAALYREFAPVAHGVALARVGPDEADDVVQETFVTVHRSLADLREPDAFPGWLRSVAANAATDRLRRRARRPVLHALPPEPPARDAHDDPDAELRARALARLQELPEPYRETLVWRLVEGLTGPEIAELTGLTEGSVRVNLCRGMALLRPLLRKDGWQ
jgi:RNA polymerase sigma-70 factor (ECF subfamily)